MRLLTTDGLRGGGESKTSLFGHGERDTCWGPDLIAPRLVFELEHVAALLEENAGCPGSRVLSIRLTV
jgi:hypothetical protein